MFTVGYENNRFIGRYELGVDGALLSFDQRRREGEAWRFAFGKNRLLSVNFHEIEAMQHAGDWDGAGRILVQRAQQVEAAGADFSTYCTNTMHKVAAHIEAAIDIPLLHLADATANIFSVQAIKA